MTFSRRFSLVIAGLVVLVAGLNYAQGGKPTEISPAQPLLDELASALSPADRQKALDDIATYDLGKIAGSGEGGTDPSAPVLGDIALTNADPELRLQALELLGEVGKEIDATLEEKGPADPDGQLRDRIHGRHHDEHLRVVAEILGKEANPDLLIGALTAFEDLKEQFDLQKLDAQIPFQSLSDLALAGPTAEVRGLALDLFFDVGSDAQVAKTLRAAARDPDPSVAGYAAELQALLAAASPQEPRPKAEPPGRVSPPSAGDASPKT